MMQVRYKQTYYTRRVNTYFLRSVTGSVTARPATHGKRCFCSPAHLLTPVRIARARPTLKRLALTRLARAQEERS